MTLAETLHIVQSDMDSDHIHEWLHLALEDRCTDAGIGVAAYTQSPFQPNHSRIIAFSLDQRCVAVSADGILHWVGAIDIM